MAWTEVVKAAAAVYEALNASSSDQNFRRWQSKISEQLTQIYGLSVEILADLQKLRVDLKNEMIERHREDFLAQIQGATFDLLATIAGVTNEGELTKEEREKVQKACAELRNVLGQTNYKERGFTTLPLVFSSHITLRTALKIIGANEAELDFTDEHMLTYFYDPSFDQKVPGSFAMAARKAEEEAERLRREVSLRLRDCTFGFGLEFDRILPGIGINEKIEVQYKRYQYICAFAGNPDVVNSITSGKMQTKTGSITRSPFAGSLYMHAKPALIDSSIRKVAIDLKTAIARRNNWLKTLNEYTVRVAQEREDATSLREWMALVNRTLYEDRHIQFGSAIESVE